MACSSPEQLDSIAALEQRVANAQAGKQPARTGGPVPDKAFPGDTVTFTVGRELFAPVKYNTFEVGPISVTTTVGPGETMADAFARAHAMAYVMFESEFHLKRVQYFERMASIEVPR